MSDLDVSIFWDDSPDLWDAVYLGGNALPGIARVSASHGRKLDTKSAPGTNGARIVDKGYQPAKVDITLKLWTKAQLEAWFRIAPTLTYRREPPRRAGGANSAKIAAANAQQLELAQQLVTNNVILQTSVTAAAGGLSAQEITAKNDAVLAGLAESTQGSTRARALERHDFDISHPALDTLQIHRVYIEEVSTPNPSGQGLYEVKIKAIESKAPRASSSRSVSAQSTAGSSFARGILTQFDAPSPSSSGEAAP